MHKVKHHIVNFLPALRSANYRLYFLGFTVSMIGTWFAAIAEQWLIYPTLSDDKSLVSLSYMVNLLPTALLVLFAGVFIDRMDKRKITIIFQILYALISLILFVLIVLGHIQIWHVFLATFLAGIIFAFESTSRMTVMIDLVERKDLPSALSLNGAIFNGARAIGPALAGLIIATLGIPLAYLLNAISFFGVVWSLLAIKLPPHEPPKNTLSFKEEFKKGFRYIFQENEIIILLSILFLFSFFEFSTTTLMPIFAHDVFAKGEVGFGLLQSFIGIGAVTSGLLFSKIFEKTRNKFNLFVIALIISVITGILFSFSTNFVFSLSMKLIGGFVGSLVIALCSTSIQLHVPNELRGRIISFFTFCLLGGMAFGSLLLSQLINPLGPRVTYFVFMSSMSIFITIILFMKKNILIKKMNE